VFMLSCSRMRRSPWELPPRLPRGPSWPRGSFPRSRSGEVGATSADRGDARKRREGVESAGRKAQRWARRRSRPMQREMEQGAKQDKAKPHNGAETKNRNNAVNSMLESVKAPQPPAAPSKPVSLNAQSQRFRGRVVRSFVVCARGRLEFEATSRTPSEVSGEASP